MQQLSPRDEELTVVAMVRTGTKEELSKKKRKKGKAEREIE